MTRKNILLVNPYIYDFSAYDLWLRPLGLLYIASILKTYTDCELHWLDTLDRFQEGAYGIDKKPKRFSKTDGRGKFHRQVVELPPIYDGIPRDYFRYGMPLESFHRKLDQIPPVDIILLTSLMTYWIDGVALTIEILRERFPGAKIVLGGILPTLVPLEQLKLYLKADIFVRGYGESRVLELMKAEGVTVRSHPDFSDVDAIPYPAVEFLGSCDYLPLMTSRGCPFHCTYCASNLLNPSFVQRKAEHILEEIYTMHDTHGTRHFTIFDDALLIDKQNRFLKIFREVGEKLDVNFHTPNGLHAGEIDAETAEVFFKSGFKMMRLSFESTSSDILSRSSDKVTVAQMVKAVENLEAAGYRREDIGVYLLFGVPGQLVKQLDESLDFVKSLGVTPRLSYYSPVPGTKDFQELQKKGLLSTPVDPYETNKLYYLYEKSGFTSEEYKYIIDKASSLQH
jgi:radical SAM superfamily enzyme YgiQ (UPF0313 family)